MDSIVIKALEISRKHQFSPFSASASAVNGAEQGCATISACENHLDVDFMALLDQGAHLDIHRMPL